MNKKGFIGDLLDLFYLIGGTVVIILVASLALNTAVSANNQKTLFSVAEFERVNSAINNLRVSLDEGNDIDPRNIDNMIKDSKAYQGKIITTCLDYQDKTGCESDPIKVAVNSCAWDGERCENSLQPKANQINCQDYKTEEQCSTEELKGSCVWGGKECLKVLE